MYEVTMSLETLINNYSNEKDRIRDIEDYPIEIQQLAFNIFKLCRRILLNPRHIVVVLNDTLGAYEDLKDKIENRKNQIVELKNEIDILKNAVNIEKAKLIESEKVIHFDKNDEMTVTNIANYLGVSRQTIYNLKKRGELK